MKDRVKDMIRRIEDFSPGELMRLRKELEDRWGMAPPDVGVREPRRPRPRKPRGGGVALSEPEPEDDAL